MSRPASPERTALRRVLEHGFTGTCEALADLAGVPKHKAQAALKELSREGEARARERRRIAGRSGAALVIYEPSRRASFDSLGFALQAWR
ncbi:hypothetical protein [Polaromonas sp.]|uniref:hypothetical protein n=1 Tax=Polaromonas sp. TaxID=1869339 RepID=UPI00356B1F9C